MKTTIIVKTKTRNDLEKKTYDRLINDLIRLKRNSQGSLDRGVESLQSSESSVHR